MNKNTKIWANYGAGAVISSLLLYSIYRQAAVQLARMGPGGWHFTGPLFYLWLSLGLMLANTCLEAQKWRMLANTAAPVTYAQAYRSYLAGIACGIITPNRIGEYPGRILYLGGHHTFRFVNGAVLGVMAQLWAIYIFGLGGLVFYNVVFPSVIAKVALLACIVANCGIALLYWRIQVLLPLMEKISWLRKITIYAKLAGRITTGLQIKVIALSLLRFAVFTAQYLFLLKLTNVDIPLAQGFCMAALFFWVMAVIPSIALGELGIRGQVGLYLFAPYTADNVAILTATAGIWLLNVALPAILGSLLMLRMKFLR